MRKDFLVGLPVSAKISIKINNLSRWKKLAGFLAVATLVATLVATFLLWLPLWLPAGWIVIKGRLSAG